MNSSIVHLNNKGIAHLDVGDLKGALNVFREVLFHAMESLKCSTKEDDENTAACATTTNNIYSSEATIAEKERTRDIRYGCSHQPIISDSPCCTDYCALSPAKVNNSSTRASKSIIFVHCRGITLVESPQSFSTDSLAHLAITTSIVMFNIAVVYHLKGLGEKSMGFTKLAKAKSYYLKSLSLLSSTGVGMHTTGNAIVDFLMMTLLNNTAQVCYEINQYDQSRVQFDRLVQFALTVTTSAYDDAQLASLVDHHKSQFLLNVIILRQPTLASAA